MRTSAISIPPSKLTSIAVAATVLSVISLFVQSTPAGEPPFAQWVTMGTESGVFGWGTAAVSPTGELHVSGRVDTALIYDPARPGGGPYDVYTEALLKFDRDGRLVSTNRLVGVSGAQTAFDAEGNQYLTGNFDTNGFWSGWVTSTNYLFDPAEVHGFFLAKYSPGGQLLWVRSQALADNATMSNRGWAMAVDAEGNIFVGGVSQGPMTLGNIQFGDGGGPLVCKYDRDGQLLWVKRVEHQNVAQYNSEYVYDLSVDPTGHIVVCGFLSEGSADFGGTTVVPGSTDLAYGGDWFLARYKPSGDLDWVKLGYGTSTALAKNGDIYATFAWPKDPIVANGLAKFNSSGNLIWSRSFSVGYVEYVALDSKDEPVLSGSLSGAIQLDGINLVSRTPDWDDILLAQTDSNGTVRWAISGGGPELDRGGRVLSDSQGNIFLTGQARKDNGSFDGLALIPIPVSSNYFSTLFAAKLNSAPLLKLATPAGAARLAWPVRATNYVLEASASLPTISWTTVTNTPTVTATNRSVQLPLTSPAKFFRLRKP